MAHISISRFQQWSRRDQIILVLLFVHLIIKVALFTHYGNSPLYGDEVAYVDGGRALSNAVRDAATLNPVDADELRRNVVGSGWFMPGSSLLLTPLFVFLPDASTPLIRGFLAVASLGLFVWCVVRLRLAVGPAYAIALAVVPGLIPAWALFGMAAWGDLLAGLVLVLLSIRVVEMFGALRVGIAPTVAQGAILGLLSIVAVYFRSSVLPLVAFIGLFVLVASQLMLRGKRRVRAIWVAGVSGLVFIAVLAPWSLLASNALGARVLTTTSVPTVMANTFGDREEICFGPCDPGSTIWFTPLRYSREVARATGFSEIEVQKQMSMFARRDVTAQSYAQDVVRNTIRYASKPGAFLQLMRPPSRTAPDAVERVAKAATYVLFYGSVGLAIASLLAVSRGPLTHRALMVLVKISILSLLIQPFVHLAGSRYWTTAASIVGLGLGAFTVWAGSRYSSRRLVSDPSEDHEFIDKAPWLIWLQGALSALALAVGLGLIVVAYA